MTKEDKFIDVEKLIKSKNPRLLKLTPGFLLKYLKRKIREDDVNQVMYDYTGSNGFEFSKFIEKRFRLNLITEGIENIPKKGGVIFTVNHPLGGLDAISVIAVVHPYRNDFKFVVNDLLLNLEVLKDMFVGLNKHGTNSKQALEDLNKVFASDQGVFVYPAGLVSRKTKGKIEDLEWKKTFVTRSRKFERDVVPVYIDGELSKFFYRLSNFRTKIGIKANIEMLYLVDELFKQQGKTIRIKFGKVIPHETFDRSKKDAEWAQWVKAKVYALREK